MTIKISKNIAGYEVVKPEEEAAALKAAEEQKAARASSKVVRMTEKVMRPQGMEALEGSTYKIKTPLADHAMYVTINDITLNPGTVHEQRRPFEIFINSKNMDHFQWIVALTRLMSAVFRKGGDVTFLAEELQAVFDPKGGYFKPGGKFMPSIIAEIGEVIDKRIVATEEVVNLVGEERQGNVELRIVACENRLQCFRGYISEGIVFENQ